MPVPTSVGSHLFLKYRSALRLIIHCQMTSNNFKRDLGVLESSKFDCFLCHVNHTHQLLHHSNIDQQGDTSSSRRLALKRNTCGPTAIGKITARGLFLTAPGTTSTGVACFFNSTSNFSNQRVLAKVRAHAVPMTPLVVAHRSLPCDKKVVTKNGRSSSFT